MSPSDPLENFLNTIGEQYGDFLLTKSLYIKELQSTLKELIHVPSGAQIMHLKNKDPENLFCLSFKTLPNSSNGAAHILEHTVLCGSRKFPVKDPFFSMTRRSLNTFMNALTGADFTCYPAASQVEKDFYNLLDVYLDAVFHPKLKEFSFAQEGWRLEFAHPQDPTTALEYKGIVYNEMKGGLSSAEIRLWHRMMAELLPELPYAFNSGGDPKDIPCLTYDELIAFHETYYHPSRCLFFFYGNIPLKHHLNFIEEHALKNVAKAPPIPPLPLQQRFTAPVKKIDYFPVNKEENLEKRAIYSIGWLTATLANQDDALALQVLDIVLMETDASPLKHALLDSRLCIQVEGVIDTEMSEIPYLIICKGCQKEKIEKLKEHLFTSLKEIIKEGIPKALIDAAVHQLEFDRMEISGDHAPFGLTLFMRSALAKQHGCPPENALTVHALFERLLQKLENPNYLLDIIKKYLIDNPHYVELVMLPDPELIEKELEEEKKHLNQIKQQLDETEIQKILTRTAELSAYQKQTENQSIDCLPKVTLDDVNILARDIKLKEDHSHYFNVYHHDCFTNKILYADLVFELPHIAEEDLPYLPLLASLLPEIGAAQRNYLENLDFAQAHTGGVSASCSLNNNVNTPQLPYLYFTLRGKALYRKKKELFTLLKDMAVSPHFTEIKRIKDLIHQFHNSLQNRFNKNGMRYATQLALSGFSQGGRIFNLWHGLPYFHWMEKIAKNFDKEAENIVHKLNTLHQAIFLAPYADLILSCEEDFYHELKKENFLALQEISFEPRKPIVANYSVKPVVSQARLISSPVAFTTKAYKSINYLHPHAPALSIATELLSNTYLHKKIREEGGAYGSGATFLAMSGFFYFHSYRDPHIAQTLKHFDEAISRIALGRFAQRDLEEAKLGIIQQLDTPITPGSKAFSAYMWKREGKTHAIRQHCRDQILSINMQELKLAVEKELLSKKGAGITVTFAGKEQIEKENTHLTPPLPIFT